MNGDNRAEGLSMNRTTALVYVRVSRLERDDRERLKEQGPDAQLRDLSPRTQIAQVKALQALRGLKVEVFEDLHRSGKNAQRPGLTRLRERMREGDVAVVAVWSMSRLGRSVRDLYDLIEEMQTHGVAFVSAKESLDTSTASGRAFFGILATLAQFERELTSERIAADFQQAAAAGRMIGDVPFGFVRESGEVSIDPDAAALVRLIFREYATGRYSYRSLAEWLNAQGQRSPNAESHHRNGRFAARLWVADMVKAIMRNERYAGRVIYRPRRIRGRDGDDEGVPAAFPAIVDAELWAACATVRGRNASHNGVRYSRTARYALTGLLRCRQCGGTVHEVQTTKAAKVYAYYVCRARYGSHSCSQPLAPAPTLEAEVRSWLEQLRLPEGFTKEFAAAVRSGRWKGTPARHTIVKVVETRLERLRELFEMGDLERPAYIARRDALQAELADLTSAPPPVVQASETIANLTNDWDDLDGGARRQVLGTIFSEVVVDEGRLVSATPKPGWLDYIERTGVLNLKTPVLDLRRRRESDPRWRFCRPLPYHLATSPRLSAGT